MDEKLEREIIETEDPPLILDVWDDEEDWDDDEIGDWDDGYIGDEWEY